jgi:hypothetical protein
MSIDSFERYPLLFGPSPVHRLDRLTEHLGGASIWAKREDCNSGIAYGGNKTRKLEYLVAGAKGCDTLVSIGGVQSNHTDEKTGLVGRDAPEVDIAVVVVIVAGGDGQAGHRAKRIYHNKAQRQKIELK